jgi:hypothetical protein
MENKDTTVLDVLSGNAEFKTNNVITFDNSLYYILGFAFVLGVILIIVSKRVKS